MKTAWLSLLSMIVVVSLVMSAPATLADDEKKESDKTEQSEEKKEDDKKSDDDEKEDAKKDEKAEPKSDDKEDEKSDKKEEKEETKKRKTHKVKASELELNFSTSGVFVAREMTEVKLDAEAWSSWEIKSIVPHGKHVKRGEVLVEFDSEKIKEALEIMDIDLRLGELKMMKAESDLPRIEKAMKHSFEQADRALEDAETAYKDYTDGDRERMIKSINLSLKMSEQRAEEAREELEQLEKMYKADDLTEETEEIVLKRQRAAVEMADFMLEVAKLRHERTMERSVPRSDIEEKELLDRVRMSHDRAKITLDTDLSRVRYEFEKAKKARAKEIERHAKMTKDLSLLTIKAPADGIVYYGQCSDGKWNSSSLISRFKPEGSATAKSVLMTIVQPKPLYVISSVAEANRPGVDVGQKAVLTPTGDSSVEIEGKVSEVSAIPVATGKFSLELDVTDDEFPEWLVPGMTGKAKVITYSKEKALMVPMSAVHEEEKNDDKSYVWIVEDGEVEKRQVKTGKTKGKEIEITDGLKEGDVISLDDEKKKEDDKDE